MYRLQVWSDDSFSFFLGFGYAVMTGRNSFTAYFAGSSHVITTSLGSMSLTLQRTKDIISPVESVCKKKLKASYLLL